MEKSLHRHHVAEAVSAHLRVAFPQLAAETPGLRATPDFRGKNFRQLSLSASLLYVLKRLKKTFPFAGDAQCVAEVLLQQTGDREFAALLERVYPNKVQRCFELLAMKLLCFALLASEVAAGALDPLERDLAQMMEELRVQADAAKVSMVFVEGKLLRPLVNDAGWQLLTAQGADRVAEIFRASCMPALRAFAHNMAQRLSADAVMPESLFNLSAEPSPATALDRKSFLLERFIRPHADVAPPPIRTRRKPVAPEAPCPRARPAIAKQPARSLKFCFEPKKLVQRKRPLPKWESLLDISTLRSLRELEGATQNSCCEERPGPKPKMPSCAELFFDDPQMGFSLECDSPADQF